ncbi:hypothetical protein BH18PSE1_BH18PSE1_03800 [soil metagenome]
MGVKARSSEATAYFDGRSKPAGRTDLGFADLRLSSTGIYFIFGERQWANILLDGFWVYLSSCWSLFIFL